MFLLYIIYNNLLKSYEQFHNSWYASPVLIFMTLTYSITHSMTHPVTRPMTHPMTHLQKWHASPIPRAASRTCENRSLKITHTNVWKSLIENLSRAWTCENHLLKISHARRHVKMTPLLKITREHLKLTHEHVKITHSKSLTRADMWKWLPYWKSLASIWNWPTNMWKSLMWKSPNMGEAPIQTCLPSFLCNRWAKISSTTL